MQTWIFNEGQAVEIYLDCRLGWKLKPGKKEQMPRFALCIRNHETSSNQKLSDIIRNHQKSSEIIMIIMIIIYQLYQPYPNHIPVPSIYQPIILSFCQGTNGYQEEDGKAHVGVMASM
jgi:hypothetical protein